MTAARPLAGLKVLELGALIAGPFCAKILAEFGAEVIKIEPPGQGDPLRKWRYVKDGTSVWWHVQSRGKKSVALDLRKPEGQAIARKLALAADIVVENFRPGTMEDWGMGYDALAAGNPGLVMVRISGYGQTGPYRERPGFGVIGEAMGGLRHVTGTPDRPPSRTGISIGDTLSALYGVIGAMMALESRRKTGRGQVVDVALYESVFSVMESLLPEFDAFGAVRERTGSILPGIAPSSAYRCNDGSFVLIGANADSIFKRLCRAMARDDLANDASLAHNDGRAARQAWLDGEIEAWTSAHSPSEILAALEAAAGAGVEDLLDRRHRRRPALRGARDDPADPADRRHDAEGAGRRAEALRHARRFRRRRSRTGRAHRRGAARTGLRRGGHRRSQAARRDRRAGLDAVLAASPELKASERQR